MSNIWVPLLWNNNNFGFRYDLVPPLQLHSRRPALEVQWRWEWNDIRSLAKPLCFVTSSAIAIAFVIAGGHGHHKQRNLCWLQFKKPSKIGTFILYGVDYCCWKKRLLFMRFWLVCHIFSGFGGNAVSQIKGLLNWFFGLLSILMIEIL